jgi:hypothetical protein
MKLLKVIRRFEKFNFHGVAELPEPMFQRDNYAHYTERLTGKTIIKRTNSQNQDKSILIGYIKDDFENKRESFHRVFPQENTGHNNMQYSKKQ